MTRKINDLNKEGEKRMSLSEGVVRPPARVSEGSALTVIGDGERKSI